MLRLKNSLEIYPKKQKKDPWEGEEIIEQKYEKMGRLGNYLIFKVTRKLKNGKEKISFIYVPLIELDPATIPIAHGRKPNNDIAEKIYLIHQ